MYSFLFLNALRLYCLNDSEASHDCVYMNYMFFFKFYYFYHYFNTCVNRLTCLIKKIKPPLKQLLAFSISRPHNSIPDASSRHDFRQRSWVVGKTFLTKTPPNPRSSAASPFSVRGGSILRNGNAAGDARRAQPPTPPRDGRCTTSVRTNN